MESLYVGVVFVQNFNWIEFRLISRIFVGARVRLKTEQKNTRMSIQEQKEECDCGERAIT